MQDVDLFMSLAEIAGVFVGFGALIAIRSGGSSDVYDVAYIGMVVWVAIQVVVYSLAPVVISRFDVTGHALWVACAVIVLAGFFIGDEVVMRISAERRAVLASMSRRSRVRMELTGVPFWLPAVIALGLILLGVLPDLESALYFAAIVLVLLMDAVLLLVAVNRAWRPQTP
jgi:hypothetical protein